MNPKKKFIQSFEKLKQLFKDIHQEYELTLEQVDTFNDAQAEIINYFNHIENQLNPEQSVELPWTDQKFIDKWNDWKKYKIKEKRKGYTIDGEIRALNRLMRITNNDMNLAIETIQYSMDQDFTGIYLENKTYGNSSNNKSDKKRKTVGQSKDYSESL
jgi:hypothetical protein